MARKMKWTQIAPDTPDGGNGAAVLLGAKEEAPLFVERYWEESDSTEHLRGWRWRGGAWLVERLFINEDASRFVTGYYNPDIGDFIVVCFSEKHVRVFPYRDHDALVEWTHPAFENDWPDSFCAAYSTTESAAYFLFHDTLLRWDGKELQQVWKGADVEYHQIVHAPGHDAIVAYRYEQPLLLFNEEAREWQTIGGGKNIFSTCYYSEAREALCALFRDEDVYEHYTLHALAADKETWTPVGEPVELDALNVRPRIIESGGLTISWTELDEGDEPVIKTYVLEDDNWQDEQGGGPGSAYVSLRQSTQRLFLFDHHSQKSDVFDPEARQWSPYLPPIDRDDALYHDCLVVIAPDHTHYIIDSEGAVWSRTQAAPALQKVAEPGGHGGTHLKRVCAGWDPLGERIVTFGGYDNQDTFVLQDGEWRALTSDQLPGLGLGSMVTTPDGLFLACYGELWRLDGDQWRCVGVFPDTDDDGDDDDDDFWEQSIRHCLSYDAKRNILLATYPSKGGDACVGRFETKSSSWKELLVLPSEVNITELGGSDVDFGVDAESHCIFLIGANVYYQSEFQGSRKPRRAKLPLAPVR